MPSLASGSGPSVVTTPAGDPVRVGAVPAGQTYAEQVAIASPLAALVASVSWDEI